MKRLILVFCVLAAWKLGSATDSTNVVPYPATPLPVSTLILYESGTYQLQAGTLYGINITNYLSCPSGLYLCIYSSIQGILSPEGAPAYSTLKATLSPGSYYPGTYSFQVMPVIRNQSEDTMTQATMLYRFSVMCLPRVSPAWNGTLTGASASAGPSAVGNVPLVYNNGGFQYAYPNSGGVTCATTPAS